MTVKQGLTSVASSDPAFSNQHIQNSISDATVGWISKSRSLAVKIDASEVLTESQKSDLYESLETVSYLNIGRYFEDLDKHTTNILNGSLGEPDPTDGNTGTFLEHLGTIDSIQSLYESLYGQSAGNNGKSVDDFVGSLRGTLIGDIQSVKSAVTFIDNLSLSSQTDYETALQDLIDFIDTLDDSTFFDESTFNSLRSVLESCASTFHTDLSAGHIEPKRQTLINVRSNVIGKITSETNNLGSITTYSESLSNVVAYQSLASNDTIKDLIIKSTTNDSWKDYFENYDDRFNQQNPLFDTNSTDEEKINQTLKLKGLPDVTQYLDLDSVAQKALRDDRIKTRLGDSGKTSEKIIEESCVLLGIGVAGKNVYTQSKQLLDNLNKHDRDVVKQELELNRTVNTNS